MAEFLSIEVTTKCNLRCVNCFAHDDGAEHGHMSREKAMDILREGAGLGFTGLSITGGEPFLWPHLFDLTDRALSLGYDFILINTNAHLLDRAVCERLAGYGEALEVTCSLNGEREEHERVRGRGTFDKASAGIRAALEQGLNLHVYTVVNRNNLQTLPRFADTLFKDHPRLGNLVFIQLRGIDDGYYRVEDLKLEPRDFIHMVRMTGFLSLGGFPVQILENPLATVAARRMGQTWLPPSPPISRPGKIVVLQDGTVTDNHSSTLRLGRYTPGSLKGFLESASYGKAVGEDDEACRGCGFIGFCREGGMMRPSSRYHNTAPLEVPFCRKVLELLP